MFHLHNPSFIFPIKVNFNVLKRKENHKNNKQILELVRCESKIFKSFNLHICWNYWLQVIIHICWSKELVSFDINAISCKAWSEEEWWQ